MLDDLICRRCKRPILALAVVGALALSACGGSDDPPDQTAGRPETSAASGAATTATPHRAIGDLFPALPAPYGYNPQDPETAAKFEELLASSGKMLVAAEGRAITHQGQPIGSQIGYLFNEVDQQRVLDGYVDSTGGGKVSKVTLAGAEVHFIERRGGDFPFANVYFSSGVGVFVSTSSKAHADTVMSAVVTGL